MGETKKGTRQFVAFRVDPELKRAMQLCKQTIGTPYDMQTTKALEYWLETHGFWDRTTRTAKAHEP